MTDFADELRRFNDDRRDRYRRWPTPDEPLPIPATGVGGDTKLPEQDYDERD